MLDEEIKIEDKIEELLRMTADKRYRELKLQLVEMNEVANILRNATGKSLLILDEPITGLDPMAIQDFYQMLRRLNREDHVAILMVSHDLRNAVEEANKILHLQKQVLFYGPAHDYMNSQAAGHFFHEKEQGRCKPTAGCHAVHLQADRGLLENARGRRREHERDC